MAWQIFSDVTFTNGSKNIAVNDSTATAGILAGFAVNKDNKSYEIESITSNAIILVDAWAEAAAANVKIKIQPTSEPIKEYIQETVSAVKELAADYLARLQLEESIISSTGTVPFTDSAGVSHDIPGWGNLDSLIQAKIQELSSDFFVVDPSDILRNGVGRSSSIVRFYFGLSSLSQPSSITVDGSFSLYNVNGFLLATGLTATDIILSGASSPMLAVIDVSGVSGAEENQGYELRSESTTSKIKVN